MNSYAVYLPLKTYAHNFASYRKSGLAKYAMSEASNYFRNINCETLITNLIVNPHCSYEHG